MLRAEGEIALFYSFSVRLPASELLRIGQGILSCWWGRAAVSELSIVNTRVEEAEICQAVPCLK